MSQQRRYKVYFTPLVDVDANTYGNEIDVSDRIDISGIGNVKRGIDSSDYSVGLFYFSDITVNGFNFNGYFNSPGDSRSIFSVTRDRCKVRVVMENITISREGGRVTDAVGVETITFKGLINEEGTRANPEDDKITFKVLALDSVLRTTKIAPGSIANGSLASTALFRIFNTPRVTSILVLLQANLNPDYDLIIEAAAAFDNMTIKEAIDILLLASNSVAYVNDANEIIVTSRDEKADQPVFNLYGKSDIHSRENIVTLSNYNEGFHRTFTSINVGGEVVGDNNLAETYGYRNLGVVAEFLTTPEAKLVVGAIILEEFKTPRLELTVTVPTRDVLNINPLDRVSINYPLRVKPADGKFLPVVGATAIGDSSMPLPSKFGSISILPRLAFKVLEVLHSARDFLTTLKLRQTNDFVFDTPNNCIVGFAIVGAAEICAGGVACDTYNPSVIGAAQVGCTEVA